MRYPTACSRCRIKRVKCRPTDGSGAACAFCRKHSLECSLTEVVADLGSPRHVLPAIRQDTTLPARGPKVQRFVEDYISFIHDRPHSLFHEPSLRASVRQDTIPKPLLFAICALGCRFSPVDELRALRTSYFDQAKALFHVQMEELSTASLQTCLLIAQYIGAESQTGIESIYYGMAHRMAQLIYQDQSRESLMTNVDREVGKRIRLSIYTADRWQSAGYNLPFQVLDCDLPPEPAVDEHIFHSPNFDDLPSTESLGPGLWALRTQLATILGDVQRLLVDSVSPSTSIEDIDARTETILQRLRDWHLNLPASSLLNQVNLEIHKSHNKGGSFVDLFLGYNYYCTILLFPSLGRQPPTTTPRLEHAELCRSYALEFARLLKLARSEPDCHAVHYTVGHMTVVSSAGLLYFLLSEDETAEEKAKIREALLSNFNALEELEIYWPTARRWVERLTTFHRACSEWSLSESFAMNRWMIRFLLQYALPLEAKDTSTLGMSRVNDAVSESAAQTRMTESLMQLL